MSELPRSLGRNKEISSLEGGLRWVSTSVLMFNRRIHHDTLGTPPISPLKGTRKISSLERGLRRVLPDASLGNQRVHSETPVNTPYKAPLRRNKKVKQSVISPKTSTGKTIIIKKNGPISTITQALKIAHKGDHIIVTKGVYVGNQITVDKPVTITGEKGAILDGMGKYQIMIVKADSVTIEHLTFRNAGISYTHDNAAIRLDDVAQCVVSGNHLINNFFGIYLAKSHNCIIKDNSVIGDAAIKGEVASGGGIHLWNCHDITIVNNYTSDNRDGIYFEFVNNTLIKDNVSEKNIRYGLHLMYSNHDTYTGNTFRDNNAGGVVMYCKYITVEHNLFIHNWGPSDDGLLLLELNHGTVRYNKFYQNTTAIYSDASNYVTVEKNNLRQNGWAVNLLSSSTHFLFTKNNFVDNTFDFVTSGQANTNHVTQNYWSGYGGYDLNQDGIGDVPYHPVRLFSVIISEQSTALILLHSMFVKVLDLAEKALPVLTPKSLIDSKPLMKPYHDTTGTTGQIVQYAASAQRH